VGATEQAEGLIPRRRNSSRKIVSAKYGWLHMSDSIEFEIFFAFKATSTHWRSEIFSREA
jgi:hypothetical protein